MSKNQFVGQKRERKIPIEGRRRVTSLPATEAQANSTLVLQKQIGNRAAQNLLLRQAKENQIDGQNVQREDALENQSFDIRYDIELIPQLTNMSCWAAGAAMLVAWRDGISIDPSEIANAIGYWQQYVTGLSIQDTRMFASWGLTPEPPQTLTATAFAQILKLHGPLWVAQQVNAPHVIVVTGISGDGTPSGTTLYINDPLPIGQGGQYTLTYAQFARQQANLAANLVNLPGAPVYVAHL